jgi:hypothetical protein
LPAEETDVVFMELWLVPERTVMEEQAWLLPGLSGLLSCHDDVGHRDFWPETIEMKPEKKDEWGRSFRYRESGYF